MSFPVSLQTQTTQTSQIKSLLRVPQAAQVLFIELFFPSTGIQLTLPLLDWYLREKQISPRYWSSSLLLSISFHWLMGWARSTMLSGILICKQRTTAPGSHTEEREALSTLVWGPGLIKQRSFFMLVIMRLVPCPRGAIKHFNCPLNLLQSRGENDWGEYGWLAEDL